MHTYAGTKSKTAVAISEKTVAITLILLTIAILLGGVILVSGSSSTTSAQIVASQNAKAQVDSTTYSWGNIPYSGGNVTKTFSIKNNGTDTLQLTNIRTSCHCTKAHVTINGGDSPDFGMNNVSSWIGNVKPRQEAKLTVTFDPAFHGPQGIGPVVRYVSVETNDSSQSKITFSLSGTVVK